MPDIVISEFMDQTAVTELAKSFDLHYDPELVDKADQLKQLGATCRALIVRNRTQVRGALLEACAELKVVGRLGVGLDNIDLAACTRRGIEVVPATGANTVAVAEYVVATMLMLLRGAYRASDEVMAGTWPRQQLQGREAYQKQLGLIGFGAIAQAVTERARALGMYITAYDPLLPENDPVWDGCERHSALESLLDSSDVLSLHVPLTEQTRHLIDANALARMKPGAILINTARGGVVDESALAGALRTGHLGGAALDVFEQEPLSAGSMLAGLPRLILTPHIGGVTEESNQRVSALIASKVGTALRELI